MISLFLNSRGRVDRLKTLFGTIENTVRDIQNIEVLVRIDNDDKESVEFSKSLNSNLNVKFFIGDRPDNLCASYNELASRCAGDYLFVLNDDVDFLSKNWDDEIRKTPSDEVWLLAVHDTSCDKTPGRSYGSFVIHTRASYEALGYFMDDKAKSLGGDVMLWRLYTAVEKTKWINAVVDHVYHNTVQKVVTPDLTAIEYRKKFDIDPWTIDIDSEIERLKGKIND